MRRSAAFRVIDANINRAREGIRVAEDLVRFIKDDGALSRKLKALRHDLSRIAAECFNTKDLLSARMPDSDVGRTDFSSKKRVDLPQVFSINLRRAQEAVRVIEELCEVSGCRGGGRERFSDLRFRLYEIERDAVLQLEKSSLLESPLYFILDIGLSGSRYKEILTQVISGGCRLVQLRVKTERDRRFFSLARAVRKITRERRTCFVVNDRVDVCLAVDAEGVHLGQHDLCVSEARRILGKGKIIGVSTNTVDEAIKAEKSDADYIGIGPLYETRTKWPNRRRVSLDVIEEIKRSVSIPVFAIGGINLENLSGPIKAGADGVAIGSYLIGSPDIQLETGRILEKIREIRGESQDGEYP
jgi:thiamine-phosphate pyrophosphorylase